MKLNSSQYPLIITTNHLGEPVSIRKSVSKDTDLSKTQTQWNLSNLVNIITTDTLRDDQSRIDAKYKRDIALNILLGAATGGLIDGMIGADSIINGVLVGAAFGAVVTNKDDANAQIGLIFSDNQTLSVSVNKHEYNMLQSFCAANLKRIAESKTNTPSQPSVQQVDYSSNEYKLVLEKRRNHKVFMFLVMAIGMSLYVASIKFLVALFGSNDVPTSDNTSTLAINTSSLMADLFPVFIGISGFIMVVFLITSIYNSTKPSDSFLREQEKKKKPS